jgi:hypothetical protein
MQGCPSIGGAEAHPADCYLSNNIKVLQTPMAGGLHWPKKLLHFSLV